MHTSSAQGIIIRGKNGFQRILPFMIYPEEVAPEEYLEIISFAKGRFALQLLIINGGILFLAGAAGYFLAGKTLRPIEVMVDEQKRFVADASHELRTPLTSLKTQVEVALRDKKLKLKDAKELLRSNLDEVNKMKYFSDSLLELSRYESDGKDIDMEEVDLREAVELAIERNLPQARNKKIEINDELTDATIKGNPQSLVELLSILINNAVKYSPENKKIEVNLKKRKGKVIIEVTDEGSGITAKDIPYIFDRFYRADTSRNKSKTDGFGLGLSIAKSIVDIHNGDIKVESEVGKGSKFKILLPV